MIGNTVPKYLFIRTTIALFRLVAPASILYLAASALLHRPIFSKWLAVVAAAEALFYLLVYIPRQQRLQAPPSYSPVPLTKSQRRAIFRKCTASSVSSHPNDPPYPTGWFLPENSFPKRDDVVEWLLWALFSGASEEQLAHECKEELQEYIEAVESVLGQKLQPGASDNVTSMRVTLDEVVTVHRPLIWYFIVGSVDTYTTLILFSLGFKHYSPVEWFQSFPPRPVLSLLSRPAPPSVRFPFWYRPHRSTTKHPLVFLHGIGIGLYLYIPLLRQLIHKTDGDPNVGILLPELLPISMHMTPHPIPSRPAMLNMLNTIFEYLNEQDKQPGSASATAWDNVVLASHSFGTFIAGWIVRDCIDADPLTHPQILRANVAHLVLIDPIPILLSHHSVAHNFVYRDPWRVLHYDDDGNAGRIQSPSQGRGSASAWQLWYFASRDADVARTLGRAFFWTEGGLWKEDLVRFIREGGEEVRRRRALGKYRNGLVRAEGVSRRNIVVVLAGKDQIVPAEAVRHHLTGGNEITHVWAETVGAGPTEKEGQGDGKLRVLFSPMHDHASVFEIASSTREISELLNRLVRDTQ